MGSSLGSSRWIASRASEYVHAAIANGTTKLSCVAYNTRATSWAKNMPAIEPAMPPIPTTELTACRGTVSLTSVKRLAA